jgi:hypothetical protein
MALFSRSQKNNNSIELDEEASRARIQAAIDRAIVVPEIQVPEATFFEPHAVKQIPSFENESENAA